MSAATAGPAEGAADDGDPCFMTAAALGRAFAAGDVTPPDVVAALLARIDRLDPALDAFVRVDRDGAMAAAEAASRAIRAGHAAGPLHGVPVVLKDVIDVAGEVTGLGSLSMKDRRASETATVVTRMRDAGMVILGKVQTVEFAMGGWGTNQRMGTPRNPWDLETPRTPGGSSSGGAVALAAGLVPLAVGTDIGGSLRLPASLSGVTSLKPTVGRVSNHGIVQLIPSLDSAGPMARSVEDVALLYDVLRGPDPRDARTWDRPAADLAIRTSGVRGLRIGRMPDVERSGVAAGMLAAYDRSLDLFADLGAEIVDVALPFRFADFYQAEAIVKAESYFTCGAIAEDRSLPLDENVRRRLLGGASVGIGDYLRAKARVREWQVAFRQTMEGIDALLTPTTETAAIPLADVDPTAPASRFTRFVNLLALCALALPDGFTADGLPLSLQIVCRGFDEETALRIGLAFQAESSWHKSRPPGLA